MSPYGLMPKFKLNRPLNKDEKEKVLHQQERLDIPDNKLEPGLNIIKINSTYLEVTDKYYTIKGLYTLLSIYGIGLSGTLLISVLLTAILKDFTAFPYFLLMLVAYIPLGYLFYRSIKHECFLKTHYPIRFNRQTRMVYAYRVDGSIISASWDDIYFTLGLERFKTPLYDDYVSGHILSEDKQTIIDTFCLPESSGSESDLYAHWEFIRRYMEEGVEPVIESIKYYLPIENKKEMLKEGYLYLLGLSVSFTIFFLPFAVIIALPICLSRCLAIRFSTRPVWPEDIEAQCQINHDDPYQRDSTFNTKSFWKTVISLRG